MKQITPVLFFAGCSVLISAAALGAPQSASPTPANDPDQNVRAPIYRVNVVERTIRAINYQYRSGPTWIDFKGTVLLNKAKGSAMVESKQGRTEIDAHLDNLTAPGQFGPEYLTYVLWALTPDGSPHNLGELVTNSGNHASLHVTTDLQAFALIVTAEPFAAVRQPSDVVVLENQLRPDTVGLIEQVNARYELLPRGTYSYRVPDPALAAAEANAPKVSQAEYEELLEIYQAQNAVGIARSAGADQYAHTTFARAETLLSEAQQRHARHEDRTRAIQEAREAAQTAEDARQIALQRLQQDKLVQAQAEVNAADKARDNAVQVAQAVTAGSQAQVQAAQSQLEAERAGRERAEKEAAAAAQQAAQAQAQLQAQTQADAQRQAQQASSPVPAPRAGIQQAEKRAQMLAQLNAIAPTLDTPRGLTVTIPDGSFHGGTLRGFAATQVSRITQIVASSPGLRVEVDGNSDTEAGGPEALQRAAAVGRVFEDHGFTRYAVSVRGLADSRPIVSNTSPGGRVKNRRVEIVISGDTIGPVALWEQSSVRQ